MRTCLVCARDVEFSSTLGRLWRCPACGFVTYFTTDDDQVGSLYDAAYFTHVDYPDYRGQEASLRRSMRRHLQQMVRYSRGGGSVLEIGCAYGFFLDEARRHFARVVGVDVARDSARYAHEELGLDARHGDFLDLDFGTERFDSVCLWDTVEHLPRPDLVLARARTLMSPGGHLFLTTGDLGSLNARLRGTRWRHIHPPSHLHYFSRRTIRHLLERLGYQLAGIETAAYYHTLFNILASIQLWKGTGSAPAALALRVLGERLARRVGLWVNLGDTMFVSARAVADHSGTGIGGVS